MRIAIASAVFAACCSITSATTHAQSPSSTCRPQDFSSKKDAGFTIKTLRVGSLQKKISIGPCISDDVARQIVSALQAGRVRNLIRPTAAVPQPELPKINVSELSMIKVGEIEEVPPPNPHGISAFQYTVEFTKAGSVVGILSGSGHGLYVNFRDGQIEVVGAYVWMS